MATTKVPCRVCGVPILLQTAERSGGRCMVCFRNPLLRPLAARAAELAFTATEDELLEKLAQLLAVGTLQNAIRAAETLPQDGIYGFWLMREYFGMFSTIVFTEADLDAAVERNRGETRQELRWAVHWPQVADLSGQELAAVASVLDDRQCAMPDAERENLLRRVDQLCLRALGRVRHSGVLDSGVVLALGAAEQSLEETYAYAEQLCDAPSLRGFRRDLPTLRDADVAVYRQTVARVQMHGVVEQADEPANAQD